MILSTSIRQFCQLLGMSMLIMVSATAAAQSGLQDREAQEVERLKTILRSYYAEEEARAASAAAETEQEIGDVEQTGVAYEFEKVALTGTEGISALEHMSQRLEDDAIPTLRRETDIIFNVEVRRSSKLVSSKAHSLKALGKSQYIAKVSVLPGDAVITVRTNQWEVSIPGSQEGSNPSDYLVTLNAPHDRDPELHVISVDELKATNWAQIPPWLPFIGALPSQS